MNANRRLRVLHLGSPTGLYGAERWILALINNIDARCVESEVAVVLDDPRLDAPLCSEAAAMGFASTVFEAHGKFSWAAVRQVREHILSRRIDVLHTHGYKSDLIALLAARGTGCRIVTTPHGWSTDADIKLKIYELLDRFLFCGFDAVVPLSQELYSDLDRIPIVSRRLQLITNGVDLLDIDQRVEIAPEMIRWKKEGNFVLGFVGQLIARKGIDVLLKALAKWNSVPWRLAIVGEGEDRRQLEDLSREIGLANRVEFFGFRPDRLAFIRAFDIFLLPSRLEGVPRCVMEAMACRTPVIASDIPGCRDLVSSGESGLLFDAGNSEALRLALDVFAGDAELRQSVAAKARYSVEMEWSAASMARRYLDLYTALIDGHTTPVTFLD
ncbi:MAG TPA: glycosyltransferase [Nitrospira sp.]|nr:glycosyltransferase [Nitrospira sp.]